MNRTKNTALLLFVVMATALFSSCKEYYDDMQGLGERVVALENDSLNFAHQYENLMAIIAVLNDHKNITDVRKDAAGNWVLEFDDNTVVTLSDGQKGAKGDDFNTDKLSVRDSSDGKTYWVYGGTWMLDGNGNAIEVPIVTGDDAKIVDPRTISGVPVIAIDPITGHYMFTHDTQYDPSTGTWRALTNAEWTDTGMSAKGGVGDKGPTGETGDNGKITINGGREEAPYYLTYITEDKKYLIIMTTYGSYVIELEEIISGSRN